VDFKVVIFDDKFTIGAEASRVWECLLDVHCLAACLPGTRDILQVDERTFDGSMSATVGPIEGKFAYRAHVVESTPPTELLAELAGTDSVTRSSINAEVRMTLTPVAAQATQLAYHASVQVNGRLAILGDMVLRTTAAVLLDEFARRLRRQLETPVSGTHA
jgi:carbon monoxide dehydrogenase subunit G